MLATLQCPAASPSSPHSSQSYRAKFEGTRSQFQVYRGSDENRETPDMVALQAWHGGARHTSACVAPHSGTRVRQASATASTTPITTVRGIVLMNEIARHGHHHAQRRLCAKRLSLTGFAANPLLRHACQPSSTCEPKHGNFCCNVVQHRVMNVQMHVCKQDPRQRLLHVRFPPSCCDAREVQLSYHLLFSTLQFVALAHAGTITFAGPT